MYFNKFEIVSKQTHIEIINNLNQITYTSKLPFFKFNFTEKPFYGKISTDSFEIYTVVKGKNSFVPKLNGQIINEGNFKIQLKLSLPFSKIFFILIFTTILLFIEYIKFSLSPILILCIFYIAIFYNYKSECKKVKQIFTEYFE